MQALFRSPLTTLTTAAQAALSALSTLTTFAHAGAAPLDAAGAARLERLQHQPELAGEIVYRGSVRPLVHAGADAAADAGADAVAGTAADADADAATPSAPLFTYERRVAPAPGGWSASHLTRDATGAVLIEEQAHFTPGYALQRFDTRNRQQGFSGSVLLSADGRHLEYRLVRDGKLSTASEDVHDPVVSGPSLHGFIGQHWDLLDAGRPLAVRMIVLTSKQTYGFVIRRTLQDAQRTTFTLTPSHLLLRLLMAPLRVSFDRTRRLVIRYEGRVPPMRPVAAGLEPLDARVDYTLAGAAYR